jgi:hypothetical protein
MGILLFVYALCCSGLSAGQTGTAQEPFTVQSVLPGVRLTPDPRIPKEACSSAVMDADLFIRTALVASGVSEDGMAPLIAKIQDAYAGISGQLSASGSQEQRAERTLQLLYSVLLSSYEDNQTFVNTALTTGVYNCVSSDVLFMYCMKRANIPVTAVETPLHAFCTVTVDGRNVDVETTNPYGFDPGVKKELPSGASPQKKYVTVPAKKYANRRNVDDRRFLSLIYNNRMSILQQQKRDGETVGLALDAMLLQSGSPQSFTTFSQCVYNTAVGCTADGRDEDGLALVAQAQDLLGPSQVYRTYASAAVGSILNRYMKDNDFDSAFAALERYKPLLDEADYRDMREGTLVNSLNHAVTARPLGQALSLIAQNQSELSADDYVKLSAFAYSNAAAAVASGGAWLDAAALLEKGIAAFPSAGTLSNQRSVYRRNYTVEVHNKAAALYNAGDKEGALAAVREGLAQVSDSAILQNDLRRLQPQ